MDTRKEYKPLTDFQKELISEIKARSEELAEKMGIVKNREMSIALTNLEQSVMWAVKAVTA